jgi:hypothetical protein
MPRAKNNSDKQKALQQHGTLNPRPQDVRHPLFQNSEFFDPSDLLQVKYEMLRQVHVDKRAVSRTAKEFGFSRPSFYQAEFAFVGCEFFLWLARLWDRKWRLLGFGDAQHSERVWRDRSVLHRGAERPRRCSKRSGYVDFHRPGRYAGTVQP